MNAAALVRRGEAGGVVVVLADAALACVQALIRWDPVTYARRELSERAELGFPPAVRMASVTGSAAAVRQLLQGADLPEGAEILGPVPAGRWQERERVDGDNSGDNGAGPVAVRALVRVPRQAGGQLAHAMRAAQAIRSARKDPERLRIQLDPLELV